MLTGLNKQMNIFSYFLSVIYFTSINVFIILSVCYIQGLINIVIMKNGNDALYWMSESDCCVSLMKHPAFLFKCHSSV